MRNTLLVAFLALLPVAACAGDTDVDDDGADAMETTEAPAPAPEPARATPGMYTLSEAEGGFAAAMEAGDAYELNLRDDGSWSVTRNGAPFASGTSVRTGA